MAAATYGLLGERLGHSFSAPIHEAFGCPKYDLIEVPPENLADFMAKRAFAGLNVTIPYKRDVMPFCDYVSPEAAEIGAVNTVVNRGGRLYGYNTDLYGFTYMVTSAGIGFPGKKVLVLGSGGTSLTARTAAKKLGAREICVISRSGADNYGNLARHADADIIVNTTPVGMYPACPAAPLDLGVFPALSGVVDVVYNPHRTALLLQAEKLGIPHAGGLTMLVAQAKAAEELFFDRTIDDAAIERVTASLLADTTNIVLVGMPGSGKSTIGLHLAALTGRELIETDNLVEEMCGKSIPALFAERGEAYFRKLESEAAAKAGKMSGKIISTGGGIVTTPENYALLRQNARVYEIQRPLEKLATGGRPLSTGLDALRKMHTLRQPLYEAFRDAAIDNSGRITDSVSRIWEDFHEAFGY